MYCNKCGKEIPNDSKCCKFCGSPIIQTSNTTINVTGSHSKIKIKKPIYQKAWFWILIVFAVIVIIGITGGNGNTIETSNSKVSVTIVDFSSMKKEDIENWCNENKLSCNFKEEYSDTVKKGSFVSQSIDENGITHQGDKITIVYSLGKEPTTEEKNALKKAESYSNNLHMSKKGIYNQLTSQFEGFSEESAQYAIDNINADWNENALEKAKSYQKTMNMSKKAIYNQLISEFECFTKEEAQYAINNLK